MKTEGTIHIGIADSSGIIRMGLAAILKRLPNWSIQVTEVATTEALKHCMKVQDIDILMVSPQFGGWFNIREFKQTYPLEELKIVAIVSTMVNENDLKSFDENINLFDDSNSISQKLATIMNIEESEESSQDSLSQREREIIGYVVKGYTNKEIAETLFLSIHTVITHRRNITRKLQIHSAAGLTIYAIVNKIVELSEVKMNI